MQARDCGRPRWPAWLLAAVIGCGGWLPGAGRPSGEPPADLVVLGARMITMDVRRPQAEAAAVRGGVFVRVGGDAEVRPLVGPRTRVIQAGGRGVLPGLIDSHVHPMDVAAREADEPFQPLES